MTEKWRAGTNNRCPFYKGVRLIEVSVKRELTVFTKGCPTETYATMPKGIMGSGIAHRCLIEVHGVSAQ